MIGKGAFRGCDKLSEVKMPQYVESCGKHIFRGCVSLQKIELPQCVNSIDIASFSFCKQIKSVTIPNGVSEIGMIAFEHCTKLTNVVFPNSITNIGRGAFFCCRSLSKIVIPDSVKRIGIAAFRFCESLKYLYIPNSVESIGKYAFDDCVKTNSRTIRSYNMRVQDSSLKLIATPIGNKEHLKTMLPTHLHNFIQELSYEEFIERYKNSELNKKSQKYSPMRTLRNLKGTKCPRCGEWYYEDDGVCDTCGYPWNE